MEGPFSIDPTSGIMTLVGPLDKSRVSYRLNVTATDNGRCCGGTTSKASRGVVVFDVKDINNNAPRFTDCSSYSPTVLEKDNVGTFVIQVRHNAHPLLTCIFVCLFIVRFVVYCLLIYFVSCRSFVLMIGQQNVYVRINPFQSSVLIRSQLGVRKTSGLYNTCCTKLKRSVFK